MTEAPRSRVPAVFLVLLGIVFFAFSAYEWCRAPLTSWYGKSFGISESFLGFIVGASTITGIVLKFPAGVLSDVFGRKKILVLGTCFFAFTPLAYRFATTPWLLLAVRFVHGGATAIYGPVAMAVVADLFRERRAEAVGWYTAMAQCGKAVGTAAVGWAFVKTGHRFGWTYLMALPIGLLALLLACLIPLPAVARSSVEPVLRRIARSFREALREGRILLTAAADGVVMIAAGSIQGFLPIYARDVHGISEVRTGLLFSAQIVTSLLSRPITGMVSDRIGRKPMIVGGMILAAGAFGCLAQTGAFAILLILSAVFGLAEAVIHTSSTAFAADLCRRRSLGSAMGVFGAVSDVGHALGPILTGALLVVLAGRFDRAFAAVSAIVVLSAVLFGLFVRTAAPEEVPGPRPT
ncbi:MAG: MFS transporter [Planctomycetes bacterium]|nr:MFS transporter [Planctomycetota bacterium]